MIFYRVIKCESGFNAPALANQYLLTWLLPQLMYFLLLYFELQRTFRSLALMDKNPKDVFLFLFQPTTDSMM